MGNSSNAPRPIPAHFSIPHVRRHHNAHVSSLRNPKFFKMDGIFEVFRANINSGLDPGAKLCIDESLYSFRCDCRHRQYMPSKPAKYGLKFWSLVDVESTYLLDINPSLGKAKGTDPNYKNVGLKVSLALCGPYFKNSRRLLTVDKFFCSLEVAKKLWAENLTLVGQYHISSLFLWLSCEKLVFLGFEGTFQKNKGEIPAEFQPDKRRPLYSSLFGFNRHYFGLVCPEAKLGRHSTLDSSSFSVYGTRLDQEAGSDLLLQPH